MRQRLRDGSLPTPHPPTLLFDGVCNLCNGVVQFVLKREREPVMRFAALQSEAGRRLRERFGLPTDTLHTLVLVDDDGACTKSEAALRVARYLRAPWSWVRCFRIVPRPIRDWLYDRVANNRYRWFGKQEACMVPAPSIASRFIED